MLIKSIPVVFALLLVGINLESAGMLRAEDAAPGEAKPKPPVSLCIVSGEHLQPGGIVTYVYKEDGQPDRTIRLCCRKCLARFKNDPARYLKKLDELEAGGKEEGKTDQ